MQKPALLLFTEGAERLVDPEIAERFDIVRLWTVPDREAAIAARGGDIVATLTTHLDASMMERLPNLRLIAVPGAGYEGIDVVGARARGITVANAGDAHSADVADHAVALTLASVHRLTEMHAWVRDGLWSRRGLPERRRGMAEQRFGLVGLGNIGTAIARRLAPFGGEIAWWAPHPKDADWPRRDSLLDLAHWCTALIIATRGDAVGLVDGKTIDAVGADGVIVNISRGPVIDEEAMTAALQDGRLGYAALDVFVDEPALPDRWHDVPNVLLTPHVGGISQHAFSRLRAAASRNLLSALDGGMVVNEVRPHFGA